VALVHDQPVIRPAAGERLAMLGGPFARALVMVTFPTSSEDMDLYDAREQGQALVDFGHAILADGNPATGTRIVPFPRRVSMKVKLEITKSGERGPAGKFWDFEMNYYNLPEVYEGEIKGAASAFAAFIKNTKGGAGQLKAYKAEFEYDGGKGEADQLLYSQAVAMQEAGIQLMEKLLLGAKMEIASGQRS
jgi:hypothetical protein